MIRKGRDVIGLAVKNQWSNIDGSLQIESISDKKINEPTEALNQSLNVPE